MNILVINAGSSSLKYQLHHMESQTVLAAGRVERIGSDTAMLTHEAGEQEYHRVLEVLDHNVAVKHVLRLLTDPQYGGVHDRAAVDAVGHRVVHGGEAFTQSVLVNADVIRQLKKLYDLAPLHNPAHVTGMLAVEANLPDVPQVAVFDTAFHQTMPPYVYRYPIPTVLYARHKVRKYGFHGTSHMYVSQRAAHLCGKPLEQLKIITCHIGNGASIAAIQGGKSVDTSMGMTPLEGLMMGSRSGDIDPAIVPFVMAKEELSASEINSMLNKHSGLLAVSGFSGDMREIMRRMDEGDAHATLAFEMFAYRLRKYIGAYVAAMDGIDCLVFTAGIGENAAVLRAHVCNRLGFFGITLDEAQNARAQPKERRISTETSQVHVFVIPTNEERVIAEDTYRLVQPRHAP
jgi:acetate kinase